MMTLDQLKDRDIGKIGTPERDKYEFDLRLELLGEMPLRMKPFQRFSKEYSKDTWINLAPRDQIE